MNFISQQYQACFWLHFFSWKMPNFHAFHHRHEIVSPYLKAVFDCQYDFQITDAIIFSSVWLPSFSTSQTLWHKSLKIFGFYWKYMPSKQNKSMENQIFSYSFSIYLCNPRWILTQVRNIFWQVNQKMILTLTASIMYWFLKQPTEERPFGSLDGETGSQIEETISNSTLDETSSESSTD